MRGDVGRGRGDHRGLSRVLELIKIHLHIPHVAHWRTAKKKGVVVTAHWVRRGAYVCPKKDAGVGYVGVRIWVHDKIL